jgi:DNA helicase IV
MSTSVSLARILARATFRRWMVPWSSLFWLRMRATLRRYKTLFDTAERKDDRPSLPSLTLEQRKAAISTERATIVVASAGSGKTAVVVAKVRYLLASGKAKPEDILLIAFNRAAAEEMRERCETLLGSAINTHTFHSLGAFILRHIDVPVRVSSLAEDGGAFARFLVRAIRDLGSEPAFALGLIRLVRLDRNPLFESREFDSLAEYEAAIEERGELRTLDKTLVKSRGEQDIANYLYVRSVRFSYERAYDAVCPRGPRDYLPDFHLTGTNIFIEFFGVDRRGRTAAGIDHRKYAAEMEWKRNIHAQHGTRLISLYSWQRTENKLIDALESGLRDHGIEQKPRPVADILRELNAPEWESEFSALVSTFLTHYRSNDLSMTELARRAQRLRNLERERALCFLDVFKHIEEFYRTHLDEEQRIDFSDMINKAANAIRAGKFAPPWRHVIVDEFQDISIGRYHLLEQMLRGPRRPRLFAVGDDWQSINRFAGADSSIMTRAGAYFRAPAMLFLSETFRFGQDLANVSSQFITRNPDQIRKSVRSRRPRRGVACVLWWTSFKKHRSLLEVVRRLVAAEDVTGKTLLLLARYKKFLPDRTQLTDVESIWPGTVLKPTTIHSSKGLEADYVAVLRVRDVVPRAKGGRYSFPAAMFDDTLLSLVMPNPEAFVHAEERRLMYVALTRAKLRVDLICHRMFPSPFAIEIAKEKGVVTIGYPNTDIQCPVCLQHKRLGTVSLKRLGKYRCSNAECTFTVEECPNCDEGVRYPVGEQGRLRCSEAMCDSDLRCA